jgi:hypothetical protein
MDEQKITEYFLGLLAQVKMFHWATTSYATHKALDNFHGSLSTLVDSFVEVYIGRFKRQPLKVFKISTEATTDTTKLQQFLEAERETIRKMHSSLSKSTELQNILDEMMSEFNRTIYLTHLQ